MIRYIINRIAQAVVVIWLVATIVFFIMRLTPGDVVDALAGSPDISQEFVDQMRSQMGIDKPLHIQYANYLGNIISGDLGTSITYREPAVREILRRMPNTIQLGVTAFAISTVVGISIGIVSAVRAGGIFDIFGRTFAILGQSVPSFWVALLLILFVSVKLGWLPTSGMGTPQQLVLPALTLAWGSLAAKVRLTRSAMLDVLDSEYVKFLRIKGLNERQVIWKHALRNAAIPVITLLALQFVAFMTGSVIVETIFRWPGVGRLIVEAVNLRDYPLVQASVLLFGSMLVLMNLLVDILYAYIDPRIRYD